MAQALELILERASSLPDPGEKLDLLTDQIKLFQTRVKTHRKIADENNQKADEALAIEHALTATILELMSAAAVTELDTGSVCVNVVESKGKTYLVINPSVIAAMAAQGAEAG